MIDVEKLEKRYAVAKVEHDRFQNLYKKVYQFVLPDRYTQVGDQDDKSDGKNTRIDLYTSVPEQAGDHFVQRIQNILTPVNNDWVGFEAGYAYSADGNDNKVQTVNRELDKIAKMCNTFKDVSNFDSEATSFYYDLIAGTAFMAVFDGTPENPFNFKTIPFKEMVIEEGIDSMPDHFYRAFKMKNELVKQQWRDAQFEFEQEKAQEEVELLECTYKDNGRWTYCVVQRGKKRVIVEKSFKTSPFICLRWTVNSSEKYGRGCGLKALSDIRSLNKIKEYSLRALGFTLPMFTASMDGNFNTDAVVLAPGALISVPSNMTTNPTLQQLSVVQQPDIEQYKAQELEMDIKKAMFDTTIPNDPSKMTATEINRRTGELAEQLNNSFGRLINEYMYPLVKRMIEILQNFGYLSDQINVVDFNGFGYKIKINTALARQQKTQDLNDILQYMSTALQIDPTQQLIAKVVDMDKLAIKMAELSGIPSDCIRTQDEIEMLRYQEQQSMRDQQVQAIDDNVAMSNAIEQGKANAKGSM